MSYSTTKLVLARMLAEELAPDISSPPHLATITDWAHTYITAGRNPAKYHFSIPLRRILATSTPLCSEPRIDGSRLASRLAARTEISMAVYLQQSGTISVHLSQPFLLAQAMQASQAIELGSTINGLAGHPPVRVVKWVDDTVDVSRYRSALCGDTMARVSVEVAKLASGKVQENYEVLRGSNQHVPEIAKESRRIGNQIFQRAFASKYAPKLLTALRQNSCLLHDPRPGVPALTVCLPDEQTICMSDEHGVLSSLAKDACVLYMMMVEQPGSATWVHYVPDSRRLLHWQNVVSVAELAAPAGAKNITHRLCAVSTVEVGSGVTSATLTGQLLEKLGIAEWPATANAQTIAAIDEQVQRAAVHCAMAGASGTKKLVLENMEGPSAGAFLQYNHARLCRILAPFPALCLPSQWLPIDGEHVRAPEAIVLALLVAQLPEVLQDTLSSRKPEALAYHTNRLAHAVSKAIPVLRVKDMDLKVAEERARFFAAVRAVLACALRLLGCSPVNEM
ncbi:hypothetical protein FBU59_000676 [Linderina macrospora]|uniref:Uncharacterized protein n=1 Tax=Linderina macrospora TaxID=4868 RepID=A0ACC1JG60_9FUNG|nr:hypothetical protein FBU59_000676 [Linderina macrospora]